MNQWVGDVNQWIGWVNVFFTIGAMIGALTAGILSNHLGRVRMLIYTEIFTILLYAVMLIDDPYVFLLTRFLSGISSGIGNVLPGIINKEMLPTQIASKFTVGVYTFSVMGYVVSSSIGLIFHDNNDSKMDPITELWRVVLVWPVSISIIRLIWLLVYYRAETPQFYFDKYGVNEYSIGKSKESLEKIYVKKDVSVVQKYLIYQYKENSNSKKVTFCSLFTEQYRRQTFTVIIFQFFNQFSGINYFTFYSIKVFSSIGQNGKMVHFVLCISNLAATFLGMYTVDKFGRKKIFVLGILSQGFSL